MTGDYSPFWAARDYLDDVGDIRSSVFVVHGLNDWNVKTKAFAEWWYRLDQYDVPRKLWLHNGGHGGPPAPGNVPYKATENRWMDHELFGVQNGIMSEPRSTIQREDGSYHDEADWPAPGTSAPPCTCRRRAQPLRAGCRAPRTVCPWTRTSWTRGATFDTDDVLIQGPDQRGRTD